MLMMRGRGVQDGGKGGMRVTVWGKGVGMLMTG